MTNDPFERFRLDNKIAILTGGAGFLGQQYIQILANAGANVIVWDKNLSEEFRESNLVKERTAALYSVDITDEIVVQETISDILKHYNRIDVLINNAGMNPAIGSDEAKHLFEPYEKYSIDLWRKEFDVDVTGAMICTKTVAPQMMIQHSGVIVNIASGVAVAAYDNRVYHRLGDINKFKSIAYVSAKTAIIGLTRQWAEYLGPYNVRVNSFSPGGVQTLQHTSEFVRSYSEGTMLGRMAQIGEYGPVMLFLCSDASSYMTGNNLVVDGGKSAW